MAWRCGGSCWPRGSAAEGIKRQNTGRHLVYFCLLSPRPPVRLLALCRCSPFLVSNTVLFLCLAFRLLVLCRCSPFQVNNTFFFLVPRFLCCPEGEGPERRRPVREERRRGQRGRERSRGGAAARPRGRGARAVCHRKVCFSNACCCPR